jgi:hypothetical protein
MNIDIVFWIGIVCIVAALILLGLRYPILFALFAPSKKRDEDGHVLDPSGIKSIRHPNRDYL